MNSSTFLKAGLCLAILMFMSTLLGLSSILSKQAFAGELKKGTIMIVAHMDDEIIWFLPWLNRVEKIIIVSLPYTSAHLNILSKYASQYKAIWQFGRGLTPFQEYREKWLNPNIRKDFITDWDYDCILRDIIADPEVTEIYTHNPWGEYGHIHHRQVSNMVRKLAVEYGKDVWCPNMVVRFVDGGDPLATYETPYLSGLQQKTGYYNSSAFKRIRQFYLDEFVNQTFPINYWTWGGPDDYPPGKQNYFLAVSGGVDYTKGNQEIEYLQADLPVSR